MTLLLQAMACKSPEERNVSPSVWILKEWVYGKNGGGVKSPIRQRLTGFTLTLFNESQVFRPKMDNCCLLALGSPQ